MEAALAREVNFREFVFFFLVDFYGEARVLLGLPWLAIGYALWSRRGTVAEQPPGVS